MGETKSRYSRLGVSETALEGNLILTRARLRIAITFDILSCGTRRETSNKRSFGVFSFQAGFEGDRRDKILRTYVRNAYSYHLSEIFFTIVNEYTDWERTVLHPINTRDATIAALSDAQYVAPLVHTGDMLSQTKTSPATDDRKQKRTKSFFYVFDYQTRDGDYPQVGAVPGLDVSVQLFFFYNST